MLVLLGMAAIAVDSGLAFDERRQEQGGVDTGALSAGLGAQLNPVQPGCSGFTGGNVEIRQAACNGAVTAIAIINVSADSPYPVAAFDDPARCPDSFFASDYDPSGTGRESEVFDGALLRRLECIRWNQNLSRVFVVLPITQVQTTFGRVLGRTSIDVSAFAEVGADLAEPETLIPFVLGPTGGGSNAQCLFEPNAGLETPPCNGPEEGNFGYMSPYLYGDPIAGVPIICNPAMPDNRLSSVFAKGADHAYDLDVNVAGTANDRFNCPNKNQRIDEIDVQTGDSSTLIEDGAFYEIYTTEGRLRCKDGDLSEPTWLTTAWVSVDCEDVNDRYPEYLDDTPLWGFIDPGAASESGGACNSGVNNKVAMEACLAAWNAWATPHTIYLFTTGLATSPRFAWVPRVNIDPATGRSVYYLIQEFLPVYLQTIFLGCSSVVCDVVFDPGEPSIGPCPPLDPLVPTPSCGWPSSGNKNLTAMSAFVLRTDMLPFPLSQGPAGSASLVYNLVK
jgi:hypothetical protein